MNNSTTSVNFHLFSCFSSILKKKKTTTIVAIVVTYNRKDLVVKTLDALISQTSACDILIVDNSSTDGTFEFLKSTNWLNYRNVNYCRLKKNLGGAGGFHYGLAFAYLNGWQNMWLMDDDAVPEPDALEKIQQYSIEYPGIIGSSAIGYSGDNRLCFPARTLDAYRGYGYVVNRHDLHELNEVAWLPFLGFYIGRDTVKLVGLPDKRYFIWGDDVEYSERARKAGVKIYQVRDSVIKHPFPNRISIPFAKKEIIYFFIPPWKTYFTDRNKIFISKSFYGKRLWTQTIPGILFRAILSLIFESNKIESLKAHLYGLIDGLKNDYSVRLPYRK